MIGKQTKKTRKWKKQPAFLLVQRFVSACVKFLYLLETNCSTEKASELGSDTQREEGEAKAAVAPDLAGTSHLWHTRLSHWALFVCLLVYFHPPFIITTTPLLSPWPKASTVYPILLVLSVAKSNFSSRSLHVALQVTLCFMRKVAQEQIVFHNEASKMH